jgi:hypothetical protein
MGSLALHVARLPPQLRVHAADGRSFRYGLDNRLQRTSRSREHLGGVRRFTLPRNYACFRM